MPKNKVYIWPVDGIAAGETEIRTIPLTGLFAVKLGKASLERALWITDDKNIWEVSLDGFLLAPVNKDWRKAFGRLWNESNAKILIGRRINIAEHSSLAESRLSDLRRGLDLSDLVNLNDVEIPTFQRSEKHVRT